MCGSRNEPVQTHSQPLETWISARGSTVHNVDATVVKIVPLPPMSIELELREAEKSAAREGETRTTSAKIALMRAGQRRHAQDAFPTRDRSASAAAGRTDRYHPASVLHAEIKQRVNARRNQVLG